jgi:hypothetical protein
MARVELRIRIRDLKAVCPLMRPALEESMLRNPRKAREAVMDYKIPEDASPDLLRQAARCVLEYIGSVLDERPARWTTAELARAVRRLVEFEARLKVARPKPH